MTTVSFVSQMQYLRFLYYHVDNFNKTVFSWENNNFNAIVMLVENAIFKYFV